MAIQAVAAPVMQTARVAMQATMQVMRVASQGASSAMRAAASGIGRGASAATRSASAAARSTASAARTAARPNGIASQARTLTRVEPRRVNAGQIRSLTRGPAKSRDGGITSEMLKLFLDTQKADDGRSGPSR